MKKNFLVRTFFGITIAAFGGVLLLKNLEIIKFDSWNVFWGTVWAAGLILAGLMTIFSSRRASLRVGITADDYRCVHWLGRLRCN